MRLQKGDLGRIGRIHQRLGRQGRRHLGVGDAARSHHDCAGEQRRQPGRSNHLKTPKSLVTHQRVNAIHHK